MSLFSDLSERLRALLFRRRRETELDEELRFHIERDIEERVRGGADPVTARRDASVAFGGLERMKDEVREASGVLALHETLADIRYAVRTLAHNPGFTAAAILVLGLGIGAATAVFSVVRGVLIAELPYEDSGKLVRVVSRNARGGMLWQLSTVDAQAIAAQQQSFDAFGVVQRTQGAMSSRGDPITIQLGRAQAGFFTALRVHPIAGRLLVPADELPDAPPVVVVSYALAVQSLGGVREAVGQAIGIDGVPHAVVGVLPKDRVDLANMRAQAWPALKLQPPTRRGPFWLRGIGRLKDGVTPAQASADLAGISNRIFPIWSAGFRDSTVHFYPWNLRESIVGTADAQLGLFGGAVVLVLLIAVANVATLMLVRASAREHELSVRTALGATKGRLARLLVTESLVLTVLAGAFGLAIAAFGLRFLLDIAPNLPRAREVGLGAPGVLFAIGAAAFSGALIGITPVMSVLARRVTSLRSDAGRTGVARHTNVIRSALVTMEFALALPLLLGAGVLLNSFLRLQNVDVGYDATNVFAVNVSLPSRRYPDPASIIRFTNLALQRAIETPGVVAAGVTTDLPPNNFGNVNNFMLPDKPPAGGVEPVAPWPLVSPGFFQAMKIPLLEGRMFTALDTATNSPNVVLVSRSWARHYYQNESPVGRRIVGGGCYTCPPTTIVGVVGDVKYEGLAADGDAVYAPAVGGAPNEFSIIIKSAGAPAAILPAVQRAIRSLDPELPLGMTTMNEQLAQSLADPKRWTAILGSFAGTAALLAAIGIFGLMSYVVRQRRREIGVRLALGAEPSNVARMIVGRGMRFAALGIVIGTVIAALAGRWLRALLYDVAPTDPMTLAAVAIVLALAALLACWVPGYRASRIKPLEAIGSD